MAQNLTSLEHLIQILEKFPGIGRKTAQRMAFYILQMDSEGIYALAQSIKDVHEKIVHCSVCCNITETDTCPICSDEKRKSSPIIVVEDPIDVMALQKIKEMKYRYHILHGRLSPLDGIGPKDIRIKELFARITENNDIPEIILATNPNVEGEATAVYLHKILKPFEIPVTRIARGLPVGGDLEFSDEITLSESIRGRRAIR
ncbi:MAG: recombination protein RecR [Candidatus Cloacimonetes bacterium 4572_55]|nr:MAG: recombination protein RecR [Candidatus Cloacimonetes bacterium 4572_55]